MLSIVAALQLAVLSQVAAPREVRPEDAGQEVEPAARPAAQPPAQLAQGTEENPPLPRKPGSEEPLPERPAAVIPPRAERPRQLSLLSGEPLGGGSASLAWAGWSSLGIMYGQGLTPRHDLAGVFDFDWAKTEMRIGAFYRRALGKAGELDMAARLSAAWYMDFGAGWVYGENHSDRGIEFTPGLSLSVRVLSGVLSGIAEAPVTVTLRGAAGLLFVPRLSIAYETPLYPDVTVGARAGIGYRAGSGDAPLQEGRTEFTFLVLAGYQLF